MNILLINGPNLNMLGARSPAIYGTKTLTDIVAMVSRLAAKRGARVIHFQSNHEGAIIDFLQTEHARESDGILINPGALTHYGFALRDALEDMNMPIVEVHLSDISQREDFRKNDVLSGVVKHCIMGHKEQSYAIGLEALLKELHI